MPPHITSAFSIEIAYTALIVFFCFLAFYKMKEVYAFTKHKGVNYFRYSFIFFGLAYLSRLLLHGFIVGNFFLFDSFFKPHRSLFIPAFNLLVAYFSTLAILYLLYSTLWKKYSSEHFLIFANIISLTVALVGFITQSPIFVSLIQLVLVIVLVALNYVRRQKKNASSSKKMYVFYYLLALFWLVSLFLISSHRGIFPLSIKITLQLFSLAIFIILYYKISRWVN